MGSFGVACGLSNLAIRERDRTGLILLNPVTQPYPSLGPKPELYSVQDGFKPFLPAIYGTYNDYGAIENIERNRTVELMENLFNQDIGTIMECFYDTRSPYDHNSSIWFTYHKTGAFAATRLTDRLTCYGFTIYRETNDVIDYVYDEYHLIYSKKARDWTLSLQIGEMVSVMEVFSRFKSIEEILDSFSRRTAKYPGFDKKDFFAVKMLSSLNGMYFHAGIAEEFVPEVMNSTSPLRKWAKIARRGWDDYSVRFTENDGDDETYNEDFDYTYDEVFKFPPSKYKEMFAAYEGDPSEMMDALSLAMAMKQVNRKMEPSLLGTQHGNDEASRILMEISLNLLDRENR